jgi:tRNA (mo5U34)-methyltransferase
MYHGEILSIPSHESERSLKSRLASRPYPFYRFAFSNGYTAPGADDTTQLAHDSRARLVLPWLDKVVGTRWPDVRCLDMACNEGWFSVQLALRGASSVLGVDVREEHIAVSQTVQEAAGLSNLAFQKKNVFDLNAEELGQFEVTLCLGLLYHLADPVGALRVAKALTSEVCIIETQVARGGDDLYSRWGSGEDRSGPGVAVVPSDAHHVAPGLAVVLVPTLDALIAMLYSVGFRQVALLSAAPGEFSQLVDRDRVVIVALA